MTGIYKTPAIPPYCKEILTHVEVVEWRGSRVLLRDLDIAPKLRSNVDYLIEADLGDFTPDIPDSKSPPEYTVGRGGRMTIKL